MRAILTNSARQCINKATTTPFTFKRFAHTVPSTMKAVQMQKHGGPEVLQYVDASVPTPADGQVMIEKNALN